MKKVVASLSINGRAYERLIEPRMLLADFIRHEAGQTGTHVGCEHGVCGACTVLIDGKSARSCCTLAVQVEGCEIATVEGLSINGTLNELQRAFQEEHGLQCGYCTPGMLMLATEMLQEGGEITNDAIRERISDNLCRCTGYETIVNAIRKAIDTKIGIEETV